MISIGVRLSNFPLAIISVKIIPVSMVFPTPTSSAIKSLSSDEGDKNRSKGLNWWGLKIVLLPR